MKKVIIFLCSILIIIQTTLINVTAVTDKYPELGSYGSYVDDGYDLEFDFSWSGAAHLCLCWWKEHNKFDDNISLYFIDPTEGYIADKTVRIPDTVNGITVKEFYKSGAFKAFDVNPDNQYFMSDGQVVLSKDGTKFLSYAQYNESTEYSVPEGVELIRDSAFWSCDNIEKLYIPRSVKSVECFAFAYMDSLDEIVFDSFKVKIDGSAFGAVQDTTLDTELLCTETVDIDCNDNRVSWNKISKVSYYEIYQKLNNGEYKLLQTTKATSCKFPTLKNGKNYTFAVKPVAVITAETYGAENYQGSYLETFTIEGTMSEDVVLTGK